MSSFENSLDSLAQAAAGIDQTRLALSHERITDEQRGRLYHQAHEAQSQAETILRDTRSILARIAE